jgi:protocadherin Fat 4
MKFYLTPWSGKRRSGSWKNATLGFYFMLYMFDAISASITWRVLEESKTGTLVGNLGQFTANFRNYDLVTSSKNFVYDKATGNVNTAQAIDRDVLSGQCVNGSELEIIQFTSTSGDSDVRVKVFMDDINDNSPQFASELFTGVIPEEANKGFKVRIPIAQDKDCGNNGTLQYKILDANDFTIKLSTNQDFLDIVTAEKLDREVKEFHILTIQACDCGIPSRCNSTILNITVTDYNDNKPIFHDLKSEVEVEENCNAGSKFIVALNVSDKDSGNNGQFTLSVSDGFEHRGLFDITANNDLVSTKCLTYDKNKPYIDILINAVDHGDPVQRNAVAIRIAVVDINDHSPVLSVADTKTVSENKHVEHYVRIIAATDRDDDANAIVSLKIINGNPKDKFYLSKLSTPGLFYLKFKGILDREDISVYNITIEGSDHGTPPRTSYINIIIEVVDQNDNHPNCSFPKEIISLSESLPIGSFVTIVQGVDKDEGRNSEIKYSLASERNSGMFKIIESSGLITTTALLDYEMRTLITLRVNVEDNGNPKLSSFCLLTINITDINDNKPLFTNTTFNFNVCEDVAVNSVVANLSAFDADAGMNSKLTFRILFPSAVVEKTFYLNNDTGAIQILTALDREHHDFYQFQVLVHNNGNPRLSSTATVEFTILDINDNHPVFYPSQYYVNVYTNQSVGFIASVTAVDLDKNDVISYEIVKKDPMNALVNVNQSTGTVAYTGISQLDANDVFAVNLIAKDSKGHVSNISLLYLTVIAPEDDLPQFTMDLYYFNIKENVQHGTYIGKVKATSKTKVDILYYIYSGDPDGIFFINEHGEIRTSSNVDHEKQHLFDLQVKARTSGRRVLIGRASVVIFVEDVNDNRPEFQYPHKLITVKDSAPVGSIVFKVRALDPDSGNGGVVKYEMLHGNHQEFSILASGDVVVANDLSDVSNYSPMISIVASDFGLPQLSSVLDLTISIIKENSHPPFIHKNFGVIPLLRNVPVNQLFFNVTASDPDSEDGGEIYFNLYGADNATDFFGIFPEGNLYVKQSLILTNQSDFSLQLIATDRGNPRLNATSLVHISVLSMEHHQQLFQKDSFRFNIYENEHSDTIVGKLDFVATFQNLDVDLVEVYSYFTFDHVTNEIKTKQVIDREQFKLTTGSNNYVLYAKASYKNDFGLHTVDLATIVVEVKDRNDNVPMFSQSNYVVDIEESEKVGTVISKLITYDKDEDKNAVVNFSIVSSSLPDAVIVDEDGKIVLNKPLENKHFFYFNFSVQVMNIAPPHYNSTCFIEVNIHDVNNNKPHFAKFLIVKSIGENFAIGQTMYHANASDSDYGRNSRLTYTIISGNQESNFEIDRESGEVILVRELNFEKIQSYVLTISAKDSGIWPLSATQILIVNVTDVNDNAPHFINCTSALKLQENAPVGTVIMQCLAVDSDVGDNGIVRYSISRDKPTGNYFRISNNGTLYVNKPLDREQFPIYKIDIKAEDSAIPETYRLMRTKTITIELEDVNDNSPRFISAPAVSFDESASNGDYVTTLKAWDPDLGANGIFTFSKGSGDDAAFFQVDDNGRVTFTKSPSGKIVYKLNVIVTDSGTMQRTSEQELSVFMYKEGGLSFLQNRYSAAIVENEPAGTFVINVTAVATIHTDDTKVRYFMTNDSSEGLFSVDPTTGVITIKDRIDREGKYGHQVNLVIYAVDVNSKTPKSMSVRVYLTILDLNDNIPTFTKYSYAEDVFENTKIGNNILTLQARDDDESQNGSIVYEIVSGNSKRGFHINNTTGQISVASNLDREVHSVYVLNVTVSDNGEPRLSSWTVVSINILDINDNMPTFQRLNYSFTVVENYPLGTVIGRTVAHDPDSGVNGQVMYSLSGDDASLFSVNARIGTLRTAFSFDREKIDFYLFKVVASDKGSPTALSTVAWVYVSILDENDNKPKFNSNQPYIATVLENSMVGTPVLIVNASDKDVGLNSTLVYAVSGGDDDKAFRISNHGTLFTASVLDRENVAQYNLEITVSDSATIHSQRRTSTTMVTVNVADVNDHTPYFVSEDVIHVREDQDLAKPFASILAKDKDTGLNGKVLYELQGYVAKASFQIDQNSGELSLRQTLDREKLETGHINITVEAKDRGQPPKRNQQHIQIIVDDANDNMPTFQPHLALLNVYENISIGSELLRVVAVDEDQDLNGKVEYAITAGNVNGTFSIHPTDGIITLIKFLDRENLQNYQIDVTAFDFGSPTQENITTVRIHVLDVNDNEPRFKIAPSSKVIKENIQYVENLAQFVAVDDDEGENSEVVYSILNLVRSPFLSIDNVTGVVSLVVPLDREVQSSYSVIIEARDKGTPSLYTQTKFSIFVKDENDNSPVFVNPDLKPSILEGSAVGSQLCVMNATDADYGVNADISYELVNDFGRFRIDPNTGEIFTIAELDREVHGTEFELTVKATDKGNPSRATSATVIAHIEDTDDNKAVFEKKTYSAYIPVGAPIGTFVTVVSALDEDEGLNGKVIYKIERSSNEFLVQPDTGHILTTRIPSSTQYTIKIQAINANSNILQDTTTVDITTTTKHFPLFDIPVTVYNISEDAKPGYFILNVKATDSPSLQIASGDPDKHFSLDIVSKNLTVNKNLDYEEKRRYNLWLRASLNTIYSTYINIEVFVVDSNDNIPLFEQSHYEVSLIENDNTNVSVSCIIAADRDSGAFGLVEYRILDATALNWFRMDRYTGCIYTTGGIDREQNISFDFTVQARDHGLPPNANNASVHVNILDRNDNPPILDKILTVYLSEDKLPPLLVETVFANDKDETSNLLYSLEPDDTFNIDSITGEVSLIKKLDREMVGRYPLTVSVSDGKFSDNTPLTVIIKDVDDNPPRFQKLFYHVKFMELQPVGSVVVKLNISDKDIGQNSDVVYSFKRTPTSEIFRIDSSGIITVATQLRFVKPGKDHGITNLYNLTVYGQNPNHPSAKPTAAITVEVTDANDHYPVFERNEYYTYIPSVSKIGTRIITVHAVDNYDVGLNNEVSYMDVGGNGTRMFSVGSSTGHVTVKSDISSENDKLFLLEIQATDRGTPVQLSPTNANVFIMVTIENQHFPKFAKKSYSEQLKENYDVGKEFLRVVATDSDSGINGKVKYSILPGKQGKYFNVDRNTGSITIANVKLDYEYLRQYSFDVQAEDGAQNPRTDQASVAVSVTDYNDNLPEFQKSFYDVDVVENNEIGSEVVIVSATDRDTVGNTITYMLAGKDKNFFTIDQSSGKITTNVIFDYESRTIFNMTVLAKDSADPQKTSDCTVHVKIQGINEFTPEFKKKAYLFSVLEEAHVGTIVGQVSATDHDDGPDGVVQFTLVDPSGRHNNFDVDEFTGNIYVCGRLDFEAVDMVQLTVLVKNPAQRILNADNTDKASVTIQIQNSNDPPRFLKDFMKVSVYENVAVGSVLGNFTAVDEDTNKDFMSHFKYTISSGNINNAFILETVGISVVIKTNKRLDREVTALFNLTVAAIDINDPRLRGFAHLIVEVKDVNDNPPFLKPGICPGHIKENLPKGAVVLRFDASDKDIDPNKDPYTFEITNGGHVPFVVNKFTSELQTSEMLDRENVPLYVLQIKILDSGYPKQFSTTSCNVIVDDVNDNRPSGDTLNVKINVPVTGYLGGVISDVSPLDLDEIKTYTCEIEINHKDIFEFQPNSCILKMKKPSLKNYILNVVAHDPLYRIPYSLNISFNTISETTSEKSVILRLSGISPEQFLSVMNHLPCVPGYEKQIYSVQKVSSTVTDILMAHLQNGVYISRDKLSQILTNCMSSLERKLGAKVVDTNYNLCSTPNHCVHGKCERYVVLLSENRTSLYSGTEIFISAYHKATFRCICNPGYSGEYCQRSNEVCEGVQCRNTGHCVPTDQGFKCHCPPNFTGKFCGIAMDLCDPNPCSNTSRCVSTHEGPKCQCDFGGRGERCELSSIGFKPLSYMAFASLSSTNEKTKNNISFQIATVERNALIVYSADSNTDENSHFIALEIINGFLRYSLNLGNGVVRITSDVIVSDGIWHTVAAVRDKQVRKYHIEYVISDIKKKTHIVNARCFRYFIQNMARFLQNLN